MTMSAKTRTALGLPQTCYYLNTQSEGQKCPEFDSCSSVGIACCVSIVRTYRFVPFTSISLMKYLINLTRGVYS